MIKTFLVLTLMATVITPSARAEDEPREASIRAIVADQVTAWDAGDGTRFCQSAAPDISAVDTSGRDMSGKLIFCHRQLQILSDFLKAPRRGGSFDGFALLPMTWRSSILTTKYMVSRPRQVAQPYLPDGVSRTQLMEVFVRRGNWFMEAFYNVDVRSP
jgi:hypothetical protein